MRDDGAWPKRLNKHFITVQNYTKGNEEKNENCLTYD